MSRLFGMEDLRTLAARALAGGDYTPAESARVRAVPDTRTIRYYTTLGLLKPPAQMRGRTALYNETHVLQIVAIKRLQAQDLSLSDIQRRLVGLTNSRLAPIAKLPEGFWSDADQYLEKQKKQRHSSRGKTTSEPKGASPGSQSHLPAVHTGLEPEMHTNFGQTEGREAGASRQCVPRREPGNEMPESSPIGANASETTTQPIEEEFWLTPAALPMSIADSEPTVPAAAQTLVHSVIELKLSSGVTISIQFPSNSKPVATIDSAALYAAAQPLLKELIKQNIVRP